VFNIDRRQQRCLIIASDGVWDVVSATDAIDYVSRWNRRSKKAKVIVRSACAVSLLNRLNLCFIPFDYHTSIFEANS